jgi:hypothetical protein
MNCFTIQSQNGYLVGQHSDKFYIGGDFIKHSIMNPSWNTSPSYLEFIMKRKGIFFIIILVISLSLAGCGGSGGSEGSSSLKGSITSAWDAPTTRADGSPLTDLKGYWIYYGPSPGVYADRTYAGNATTYTLTDLAPEQTYYIAVTAIDASDNESNLSNEVSGQAK